jgi:hypothetical protein
MSEVQLVHGTQAKLPQAFQNCARNTTGIDRTDNTRAVVCPTVVCKTSCRCGADRHRLRLKPNEDRRGPCLLLFDKGYLIRLEDRGSLSRLRRPQSRQVYFPKMVACSNRSVTLEPRSVIA